MASTKNKQEEELRQLRQTLRDRRSAFKRR
jgi:hypothetical protein